MGAGDPKSGPDACAGLIHPLSHLHSPQNVLKVIGAVCFNDIHILGRISSVSKTAKIH